MRSFAPVIPWPWSCPAATTAPFPPRPVPTAVGLATHNNSLPAPFCIPVACHGPAQRRLAVSAANDFLNEKEEPERGKDGTGQAFRALPHRFPHSRARS